MRGNILLNSDFFMPSLLHNCSCVFDLRYIPYYMHIIIQTVTPIYQLPILLNNVLFHVHCMHLILGFNSFQVSHWKNKSIFFAGGWGIEVVDFRVIKLFFFKFCFYTYMYIIVLILWWFGHSLFITIYNMFNNRPVT